MFLVRRRPQTGQMWPFQNTHTYKYTQREEDYCHILRVHKWTSSQTSGIFSSLSLCISFHTQTHTRTDWEHHVGQIVVHTVSCVLLSSSSMDVISSLYIMACAVYICRPNNGPGLFACFPFFFNKFLLISWLDDQDYNSSGYSFTSSTVSFTLVTPKPGRRGGGRVVFAFWTRWTLLFALVASLVLFLVSPYRTRTPRFLDRNPKSDLFLTADWTAQEALAASTKLRSQSQTALSRLIWNCYINS